VPIPIRRPTPPNYKVVFEKPERRVAGVRFKDLPMKGRVGGDMQVAQSAMEEMRPVMADESSEGKNETENEANDHFGMGGAAKQPPQA